MGRLIRSQLYVILHSKGALLLLAVSLALCWVFLNDGGDAERDVPQLEKRIAEHAERGFDYLAMVKYQADLEQVEDLEELVGILRQRQVMAAPCFTVNAMLVLLFLLPGAVLTPGLGRSRGMGRELQTYGRTKPLLSRILASWVFCLLLSTGLYFLALRIWTDPGAAVPGQLLRYWVIVQFYVLSLLCYSYFMHTLFRRAAVAAPVMILAEAVLHELIPGLRLFYPISLLPYYNQHSYLNTANLLGADCPTGTLLIFCGVCLVYIVICPILAILLFRRREVR
ncbi:MAG: hypothetical protein IKG89_06025 [Oscillospiraceae bacterium]|nr:hypothetical protein [Oscillospiraceae bacterium]